MLSVHGEGDEGTRTEDPTLGRGVLNPIGRPLRRPRDVADRGEAQLDAPPGGPRPLDAGPPDARDPPHPGLPRPPAPEAGRLPLDEPGPVESPRRDLDGLEPQVAVVDGHALSLVGAVPRPEGELPLRRPGPPRVRLGERRELQDPESEEPGRMEEDAVLPDGGPGELHGAVLPVHPPPVPGMALLPVPREAVGDPRREPGLFREAGRGDRVGLLEAESRP